MPDYAAVRHPTLDSIVAAIANVGIVANAPGVALVLFIAIRERRSNESQPLKATAQWLATQTGMSRSTVINTKDKLQRLNMLTCITEKGRSNLSYWWINDPKEWLIHGCEVEDEIEQDTTETTVAIAEVSDPEPPIDDTDCPWTGTEPLPPAKSQIGLENHVTFQDAMLKYPWVPKLKRNPLTPISPKNLDEWRATVEKFGWDSISAIVKEATTTLWPSDVYKAALERSQAAPPKTRKRDTSWVLGLIEKHGIAEVQSRLVIDESTYGSQERVVDWVAKNIRKERALEIMNGNA